jgi:DNA-binding HxlR family transcriptional regulator
MAGGATIDREGPSTSEQEVLQEAEIGALLRLLGAGASCSILLALGEGPLRTKDLTTRVHGYAPRTVYRYVGRLAEIGAIERDEEPGVPSKVIHSLTDPCGTDLHDLVLSYSKVSTSLQRLSDGGIVPHSWGSLTLLADLWESGMFAAMSAGPCTATELARVDHDFSFHQVSRRTSLFMIGGMIQEEQNGNRRRHYALTGEARQATALIVGLGRWRERFAVPAGEFGLTRGETGELLRGALPLVHLPGHVGKGLRLTVGAEGDDDVEVIWAEVGEDGALAIREESLDVDGWGRGSVGEWTQALLGTGKVRTGGSDRAFARACMAGMADALWPQPAGPSTTG